MHDGKPIDTEQITKTTITDVQQYLKNLPADDDYQNLAQSAAADQKSNAYAQSQYNIDISPHPNE